MQLKEVDEKLFKLVRDYVFDIDGEILQYKTDRLASSYIAGVLYVNLSEDLLTIADVFRRTLGIEECSAEVQHIYKPTRSGELMHSIQLVLYNFPAEFTSYKCFKGESFFLIALQAYKYVIETFWKMLRKGKIDVSEVDHALQDLGNGRSS